MICAAAPAQRPKRHITWHEEPDLMLLTGEHDLIPYEVWLCYERARTRAHGLQTDLHWNEYGRVALSVMEEA